MEDYFSLNWLHSSQFISCLKASHGQVTLEYFVFGKNPRLFISSGMHGDEYKVISSVSKSIKANLKNMPSFIFVPIVTPSAVERKTRKNKAGQDVNRGFLKGSHINESKAIMKIIGSNTFDLSVSFHEDLEFSEFYMYDSLSEGEDRDISKNLTKFKQKLIKMNIGLFNGIDDPNDPDLGYKFNEGYRAFPYENGKKEDCQLESWLIRNGVSSRCFTPEIPEKLIQGVKDKIVGTFFTDLIIPFF